jgi:hypothetical protein
MLSLGGSFFVMQLVLVHLIVDAPWRDPEKPGRLRLVAVGLLQSGLKEQLFAMLEGTCEIPTIEQGLRSVSQPL